MEIREMEIKAANLEPLPSRSELDFFEQVFYLGLRNIYSMYHMGMITKENASKEKHQIMAEFEKQRELATLYTAIGSAQYENIARSEDLKTAIHKAKTKEEKGKLAMECVYCLTGDETILKEAEGM